MPHDEEPIDGPEPAIEDHDDDAIEFHPPAAYSRTRDRVDMVARVKAEGMRLDHYIAIYFQDFSRSELQKAIAAGHVTVNAKKTKSSYKVRNHDQLSIQLPEPINDVINPENIPLDVLYDDECLAVINKPSDMVVHPARGNWTGTLANALAYRFEGQLSQNNGAVRPGIVHRLDRHTSGAILIAKDEVTHRELGMQFETRKVFKEYMAIAQGELDRDSDYIEAKMKHHPHIREKMVVATDPDDPTAKHALSYYEVIERFRGYSLVKFQPRTGRTHQIRVHLLHVGCPCVADKMYGFNSRLTLSDLTDLNGNEDETFIDRQALHAFRLRFQHPKTGSFIEVEAPLPPDMRRTLDALRRYRPVR